MNQYLPARIFSATLFVLVSALLLAPPSAWAAKSKGLQLLENLESAFVEIAAEVQQGVVSLAPPESYMHPPTGPQEYDGDPPPGHGGSPHDPFGQQPDDGPGSGSGIIIDQQGHLVTNAHVVGTADEMQVQLPDGRRYTARLVGADPETDIAVLKLERPKGDKPLPVLVLGDSKTVRPGQWTIAVGHPFGLERTVTVGIVSGVGREGVNLTRYENFIQTDAPINPGNSGGPLFNIHGEVIGINTAIMSFAQGIGFAIPANMVREVVDQLIASGRVERGWLGVGIQEINADLAVSFGVKERGGVLVNQVFEDQPASRAGLLPGDIILTLNGETVSSPNTLARLIGGLRPDSKARITYLRDGRTHKTSIILGRREQEPVAVSQPAQAPQQKRGMLGMEMETLTPALAKQFGVTGQGVAVTGVAPDGMAFRKGIRPGDVIRDVNRKPVSSVEQLMAMLEQNQDKVLLRISRDGGARYVVLSGGDAPLR